MDGGIQSAERPGAGASDAEHRRRRRRWPTLEPAQQQQQRNQINVTFSKRVATNRRTKERM